MPKGKTIIHATLDPADLNVNVPISLGLVGDAGLTLDALLVELRKLIPGPRGRRAGGRAGDRHCQCGRGWRPWMPKLTSTETPMTPYRVIWDLLHTVDVANTIITHDAGSPA